MDMESNAALLEACAFRVDSADSFSYSIDIDISNPADEGFCVETSFVVTAFGALSTGMISGCSYTAQITKSTEHSEDGIIDQQCCAVAFSEFGVSDRLDKFCYSQLVVSDDSHLQYNSLTTVCQVIDGEYSKFWLDIEGTEIASDGPFGPDADESVLRDLCCLAFTTEQGHVNFDWELSLACLDYSVTEENHYINSETG